MPDEPTLGEVLRRIDGLTLQVADLVRELKEDRVDVAKTYVRQDVHTRERQLIENNISDIRSDLIAATAEAKAETEKVNTRIGTLVQERKSDENARRQMWLAIAAMTLSFVGATAALIVNIVQG